MDEEKQGLKFSWTGFRTNSQCSFNVNAIKQIPILHEHNVTNKITQEQEVFCCLENYLSDTKPINIKRLRDWIFFVLDLWFFCV